MGETTTEDDSSPNENVMDDEVHALPEDIDGFLLEPSDDPTDVFSDEESFEITDPAEYIDENFPILALGALIDQLSEQRLIVIAGEITDKRSVARGVAWEFAQARRDIDGDKLEAREYKQSTARGLLQKMDATPVPTVFVLTDAEPHQFGGTLNRLHQSTRRQHWLVLTTERPQDAWLLNERSELSWFEPDRNEDRYRGQIGIGVTV